MRRLVVFNQVTLDGYFTGENGDLSWAHNVNSQDEEFQKFTEDNAKGGAVLVFGRVTYDMMRSYWPTPQAAKENPLVAEQMNALPKIVFSKSLDKATWNNTRLLKGDPATEIRKLKQEAGQDLLIMGSGTIVSQLAQEGLIDEYQLVLYPVALGQGRTMFEGIKKVLTMKPTTTRAFRNGNVLLCYEPKPEDGAAAEEQRGEARSRSPEPVGAGRNG